MRPAPPLSQLMRQMFDAAITCAKPHYCLPPYFLKMGEVQGRLVVLGAGKASAAMARVVEDHWKSPLSGLVVVRYGHAVPCRHIDVVEAAHPVPDAAGLSAAQRMLGLAQSLNAEDVALCLFSGGGSALLPLPLPGITLEDKQQLSRSLLASGACIDEINAVRRHLSAIKGGRLAAACSPARVINLLISDVPGDAPVNIASGPTVSDTTTCEYALEILQRYHITPSDEVMHALQSTQAESLKPFDPRLPRMETHIIAHPQQALEAAARVAQAHGYTPHILSDALEGEARDVGKVLAAMALQIAEKGQPFAPPCVLLSGGETTVTLSCQGRGGRNVECLLSFTLMTRGHAKIYALMGDTDGVDGMEAVAGASMNPQTLERAFSQGINPRQELDNHNAHFFFEALGDAVITGPTLTNVNDFRVIVVEK